MATSVTQAESAIEVIVNLLHLIEVDVSNPAHVLKYVKKIDPSVETLTTFMAEMRVIG